MTVEDVGRRGGLKTSEKHGELFSGKLGGRAAKEEERGTWLLELNVHLAQILSHFASTR